MARGQRSRVIGPLLVFLASATVSGAVGAWLAVR